MTLTMETSAPQSSLHPQHQSHQSGDHCSVVSGQRKQSVKRCLSPDTGDQTHVMKTGRVKRKNTEPGLLLVQSQCHTADLAHLDTQYKLMVDQRQSQDSDNTPTYDPGSPPSSPPSLPSLPTLSSRYSQITPHSSSYTSWTKPIQVNYSQIILTLNSFKQIRILRVSKF